jgi:hypothetical protein
MVFITQEVVATHLRSQIYHRCFLTQLISNRGRLLNHYQEQETKYITFIQTRQTASFVKPENFHFY